MGVCGARGGRCAVELVEVVGRIEARAAAREGSWELGGRNTVLWISFLPLEIIILS